jgi:hypothetical protein
VREIAARIQVFRVVIDTIRRNAVWRPGYQEWIGLRGVFGNINRREQALAIPHGNPELIFCIVRADIEWIAGGEGLNRSGSGQAKDKQNSRHLFSLMPYTHSAYDADSVANGTAHQQANTTSAVAAALRVARPTLNRNESPLNAACNGLRAGGCLQFAQYGCDVEFGGVIADAEPVGDFLVCQTLREHAEHL